MHGTWERTTEKDLSTLSVRERTREATDIQAPPAVVDTTERIPRQINMVLTRSFLKEFWMDCALVSLVANRQFDSLGVISYQAERVQNRSLYTSFYQVRRQG